MVVLGSDAAPEQPNVHEAKFMRWCRLAVGATAAAAAAAQGSQGKCNWMMVMEAAAGVVNLSATWGDACDSRQQAASKASASASWRHAHGVKPAWPWPHLHPKLPGPNIRRALAPTRLTIKRVLGIYMAGRPPARAASTGSGLPPASFVLVLRLSFWRLVLMPCHIIRGLASIL